MKQAVDWKYAVGQDGTHMVLASRDGKKFFTSNIASNTVSILEPAADGAGASGVVKVGRGPEGLDLTPDGRTLWSAHSRDGGISIIDTASGKVDPYRRRRHAALEPREDHAGRPLRPRLRTSAQGTF